MIDPQSKLSLRPATDRPSTPGGDTRNPLAGRTVLVVDDNPVNIGVLVGILKSEQCTALSAPGGARALELAAKHHPSLILLDIMMPEMDGFAVCRELKRNQATASIPVIFVTALNDHETKEKARALGAVDFIEKPISRKMTVDRIRKSMAHADSAEAKAPNPAPAPTAQTEPAQAAAPKTPSPAGAGATPATATATDARSLDISLRWGLHDIKGAFGGVVGLIDALGQELEIEDTAPDPESLREYVGWIKEALRNADEATAALAFLRQLLHHTDVPNECPLYETMLNAVEALRNGARAATIELHEESELPSLHHDHELLSGLFLHLFTALHDLAPEGETLHLRVSAETGAGGGLVVTLRANGRSLHHEEAEIFFEMEKNGERRSIRSLGLALLAVQRTLHKLGASAEIEPLAEGEGNQINLSIPALRA